MLFRKLNVDYSIDWFDYVTPPGMIGADDRSLWTRNAGRRAHVAGFA